MSLISNAYSGLQAAKLGMNTVGMNVQNALTPGYSRQGILQSAVGPMGSVGLSAGNGVQVDSIRRISDQYLTSQVWGTNSKANYYDSGQKYIGALESVIGTDTTSLGNGIDKLFASLNELTTQPDSPALRQQLINEAQSMATRFNNINNFINSQKTSINSQHNATVDSVNTLSSNIAGYNQKISELEATGGNTNVLRDQRDELVKQMSTLVDVKVSEDAKGNYTVALPNGQPLVNGRSAGQLATTTQPDGSQLLTLKYAGSEYTINPATGGQLGALNDYEQGTLKEMQESVQGMAESIATMFNDQLGQGFDLNGQPGKPLFNFDLSNPAGMLTITDIKPDELALSSKNDETGNGDNLNLLIELKNKKVNIGGMGNMSINEGAAAIISSIGIASRQNQTEAEAAISVYVEAQNQRDNLSAVDQDEEAINLQVYMNAYQSNMKVIAAGNQIFSDLLNLL
ncbi:flagellar hook-associated protein FlgK [Obesumbacterium proteus]|nr:flagellar hook-associated protein FlgK [Obesumbacterium proteus]